MKVIYRANDGVEFNDRAECDRYEESLRRKQLCQDVTWYDEHGSVTSSNEEMRIFAFPDDTELEEKQQYVKEADFDCEPTNEDNFYLYNNYFEYLPFREWLNDCFDEAGICHINTRTAEEFSKAFADVLHNLIVG